MHYDSSTADFPARRYILLLPDLSFFSRSMRYQLLWAKRYLEPYQTSFYAQQEFLLSPAPGLGESPGFDGSRVQDWEAL